MGRAPCCDKDKVKKGPWSLEEDEKLKSHIEKNGTGGNWIALPQKIGLRRCGKSCRLRWLNYLRPNIKHGGFSEVEDNIICSLYNSIGSRWSTIAAQLPGRTDNDIKNYWNTRLKKKLLGKPRKDQQHGQRAVRRSRQVANRAEIRNLPAAAHETSQTPYCPHPPIYPKQDDRAAADSHGSIRKLLVGLGERFSHDDTLSVQRPLGFPSSSQHLHEKSPSLIAPSSSGNPFNESSSPVLVEHTLQATIGGLTTELDEMFYGNQMKLQEELDGICGVSGNILSECNTSSSPESLSWNEVIPLMQQEQQQCLLEELVHFGTQ